MTDEERKEIITLRLENAWESVKAAELMKDNALWNPAINRMYYACYYAVTALLIQNGIHAGTHAGVRQMFNLHFIKKEILPIEIAHYYSDLFAKRHSGDYDDYIMFNEKIVQELFVDFQPFIQTIEDLIKKILTFNRHNIQLNTNKRTARTTSPRQRRQSTPVAS